MKNWLYKIYYSLPWTPSPEVIISEFSHRLQIDSYTVTLDLLIPQNCTISVFLGNDPLTFVDLDNEVPVNTPKKNEEAKLIASSFIPANLDLYLTVNITPGNAKRSITLFSQPISEIKPDKVEQPYLFDLDGILDRTAFDSRVVSGWCFAINPLKINKIQARLDDEPLDTEFYIPRTDTHAIYADQPDAKKCGFECELPKNRTDGSLTLECQIKDGAWTEFYQSSLQTIPIISGKPQAKKAAKSVEPARNCYYNVETIFVEQQKQLKTKIVGWIFLQNGPQILEVRIKSRNKILKCRYGMQRGDVFQEFPGQTNAIYSGFEARAPDIPGNPVLEFQYKAEKGKWNTFDQRKPEQIRKTFYADQKISILKSGVYSNIEHAQIGRRFGHQFLIIGWCFRLDDKPVTDVRIRTGKKIFKGKAALERIDVYEDNKNEFENCLKSGFEIPLDDIPRKSKLKFEYRINKGRWKQFAIEDFSRFPVSHYASKSEEKENYQKWLSKYKSILSISDQQAKGRVEALISSPKFSILFPTFNTPKIYLEKAIDSVRNQYYPNWELCIADDASTKSHVWNTIKQASNADDRILVVKREENGHICNASNSALELATGEWCTFLDHDDFLAQDALLKVAEYIEKNPGAKFFYSDEDKMDSEDNRHDPYFKPDWNPELLEGQNFLCHLSVTRTDLVRDVGGFMPGLEGSQDWDLFLKITETLDDEEIIHIPYILYHWRAIKGSTALALEEKGYIKESSLKTLKDHCSRMMSQSDIIPIAHGHWRLKYKAPYPTPKATIIIPTRNQSSILKSCIESIQNATTYVNYDIVVVDNQTDDPETLEFFKEIEEQDVQIIPYPHPFNFSALNNYAANQVEGEILVFLNNDVTVINGDWLEEMVSHAHKPEIGAVGAKLYFPEDCIQHAGIILGINGVAGHCFKYATRGEPGQRNRLNLVQRISSVTAACLVVRKSVFEEVGGFEEENLGVAFNDIDLCLRIREAGYFNIWTPYAQLYHHESLSRGDDNDQHKKVRVNDEIEFMRRRWGEKLHTDPSYNPNLTLEYEDFSLAWPPRLAIDER